MSLEKFVRSKREQTVAERMRKERLDLAISKAQEIFALIQEAVDEHGKPKNVQTKPIMSSYDVPVSLRQHPHNDRSGVARYDLVFDIEDWTFLYSSFSPISGDGIEYPHSEAQERYSDEETDQEVLDILDLIHSDYTSKIGTLT